MQGYYRFPTIYKDTIVFVSEDDLWSVPVTGGVVRRLTSNRGNIQYPSISPDGSNIAFTGIEEGHFEVYCMPIQGGTATRLTFLGVFALVCGWTKDSTRIIFTSNTRTWHGGQMYLYSVSPKKDIPQIINVGPARTISYAPGKGVVIGRNTTDPARWKRYRGGTAGVLWVDPAGNGRYKKLIDLRGNMTSPMWIGNRIYFISDHEGIGNIYSCTPNGKGLKRHTSHADFYARHAQTDGRRIVYTAGADIYVFDPAKNKATKVEIAYHSPRVQTNRKFVDASKYIEDYAVHPSGSHVSITSRGKVFSMPNWQGPVTQHGRKREARYRLGRWLHDGARFVVVHDERTEDSLQIHFSDSTKKPYNLPKLDIGRVVELSTSPTRDDVALTNHRCELILVNLKTRKRTILDHSTYYRIADITWSPDGVWLAYSYPDSERTTCIKLCNTRTKKTYRATQTILTDFSPSFDPEGKYLYFLSNRHFDPVYDTMQFELSFPANRRPYLITLQKDGTTPFKYEQGAPAGIDTSLALEKHLKAAQTRQKTKKVMIDIDGIQDRVIPLPLPPALYRTIWALKDRILFSEFPIKGGIAEYLTEEEAADGVLKFYDLKDQKTGIITSGINSFKISQNNEILIYRSAKQLRIAKPIEKLDQKLAKQPLGPKSGWLDLSRIKVMVEPTHEWRQMYHDVWRLQRDHFWTRDMSGVDWEKIYKRYHPLLDRIGSRTEFSDLIWEMQGELGTSHAYEWGGDYRQQPQYRQGFLGADFEYVKKHDAYRITSILRGDPWENACTSPFNEPGLNVHKGDLIVAIDNVPLNKKTLPQELLVNRAKSEVSVTIASPNKKKKRTVTIKTIIDEAPARYREWVELNREKVHRISKNKIGYIHIPDMGPYGFGEFHRSFLNELQYPGLVVDVRFNRGGHVSPLLLEKLARKRIAYDIKRWGQPEPYPYESVLGPIVCLTNEYAGSDGDIFSHAFKLMKIGPLIGTRTWGGVIGITINFNLSDGGITTQPEFSFWFADVGWGVENYGTDPDIEVEITPQDHARGKDPQLDRALQECMKLLKKQKPRVPEFGKRPKLTIPNKL
jgi:tricorn protease